MYENIHLQNQNGKVGLYKRRLHYLHQINVIKLLHRVETQKPQQAQVGMNKPGGGTDTKKRITTIGWIPFKEMGHMYHDLYKFIVKANENHFGFGDIQNNRERSVYRVP